MNFKKLFAGIALGAMVFGAGAPAFAADGDKVDTSGAYKAEFYAYYDADKDGTKEWAPAPMGMNTGCFADGWTYDLENNKAIFDFITFEIQGMSGDVTDITGANVIGTTWDDDDNLEQATLNTRGLTTVPNTNVQGIPAELSYSALHGAMTQNMDVYLVIEAV